MGFEKNMIAEIHICPLFMRTVRFIDGNCIEKCDEKDCPIAEELRRHLNNKMEGVNGEYK